MKKDPFLSSFVYRRLARDLESGQCKQVKLRFPPEPNGYLHIGHAKAVFLNFELARAFGGCCHIRFDDTNPETESAVFVKAIRRDVEWLGYGEAEPVTFASDYFDTLYAHAQALIRMGKAYVDEHSSEVFAREYKGTPTIPGKESPFRRRSVEENLRLFEDMRSGRCAEGSCLLRARIDMSSPNLHLRDPALYRVKHAKHARTDRAWSAYPLYDFAHSLSDSMEGITHSLCTLEFEPHRPLYDWFLDTLGLHRPVQIEFSRLSLSQTLTSKRDIQQALVEKKVTGWDDPRLHTLSGLRKRGYPPQALRTFVQKAGLSKRTQNLDTNVLEAEVRKVLNKTSLRRMVVLNPLKLTLTNYPEKQMETLSATNNPEDSDKTTREVLFSKHLFIDRQDFMKQPTSDFYRLAPQRKVRLKYAYVVHCHEVVEDEDGQVVEVLATYDAGTKSGMPSKEKVKATLSWVEQSSSVPLVIKRYGPLETTGLVFDESRGEACVERG